MLTTIKNKIISIFSSPPNTSDNSTESTNAPALPRPWDTDYSSLPVDVVNKLISAFESHANNLQDQFETKVFNVQDQFELKLNNLRQQLEVSNEARHKLELDYKSLSERLDLTRKESLKASKHVGISLVILILALVIVVWRPAQQLIY